MDQDHIKEKYFPKMQDIKPKCPYCDRVDCYESQCFMNYPRKEEKESEIPEWVEHLKDITHTDIVGIRGSCGDPCYQCQRDGHLKALISKQIQESEQRGYERGKEDAILGRAHLTESHNRWKIEGAKEERTRFLTELKEKIGEIRETFDSKKNSDMNF